MRVGSVLVLLAAAALFSVHVRATPKIGLEAEVNQLFDSCVFKPSIGNLKVDAGNGVTIEGDQDFGNDNGQQVELTTAPFDCTATDITTHLTNIVAVADDYANWKTKYPTIKSAVECHDSKDFAFQATIDMKATQTNFDALKKFLSQKGSKLFPAAYTAFETCVVPEEDNLKKAAQKAQKRGRMAKMFLGVPSAPAMSPLFFKIYQGMITAISNDNTIKSNDLILFKFSFVTLYDALSNDYKGKLDTVSGKVATCVKNQVTSAITSANLQDKFDETFFSSFWSKPKANDRLKKLFKTEIPPKIDQDKVTTVCFEVRDPTMWNNGAWAKKKAAVSADIAQLCTDVNQ